MRANIKTLYINRGGTEPLYLLTQRSQDAPSAPNAWSLIGGVARDGEATKDAARRLSAERISLTGHHLTCTHEWVQSGISTNEPALRSLWLADTIATVADLTVNMQSAAFFPLRQISGKTMTDTTRVALHLVLPELVPTFGHAPPSRAVLFDLACCQQGDILGIRPEASETATELHGRGYLSSLVADSSHGTHVSWPSGLNIGTGRATDPAALRTGRPDPDLYRVSAKRLGRHTTECVYVSTDRLALVAASAAGAVPVRLNDYEHPEQNEQIHPGHEPWPVINRLADLIGMLPNIPQAE